MKIITIILSIAISSITHTMTASTIIGSTFHKSSVTTLKNWKIGKHGGRLSFKNNTNPKAGIILATEKAYIPPDQEIWTGSMIWKRKAIPVIPGLKYRFSITARSNASFKMSIREHTSKYTSAIASNVSEKITPQAVQWHTYSITYTPTTNKICYIRPELSINGWHKRLEIKSYSFSKQPSSGSITMTQDQYIISPGEPITFTIDSSSFPVTLILCGPDGTCGHGGKNGGAGAWSDHVITTQQTTRKNFSYTPPSNAVSGSYRLIASNPKGNVSTEKSFCIFSKTVANKIKSLTGKITIKPGSRLMFLGDSLTDLFRKRNYVSIIHRALSEKYGNSIEIINAGIGGDNVIRILKRLKKDVIDKKPTHVFIFEGANDIKRRYNPATAQLKDWTVPAKKYEQTYRQIIQHLKQQTKAKIIIATCAPADPNIRKMFHDNTEAFGDSSNFYGLKQDTEKVVSIQKKIATDNNLDIIDTNKSLSDYMINSWQSGKEYMHVDDGVHLSEFGNREVALTILKYLASTTQPNQ